MAVKIENNSARIENQMSTGTGLAIRLMLEDIYKDSTPNTPMKSGDLRLKVTRTMEGDNRGVIEWSSGYAQVQEQGYRNSKKGRVYFRNYTTPGTGPHYAKNAVDLAVANLPSYLEQVGLL